MLDLEPATGELGRIVHGVRDHQFGRADALQRTDGR